MTDTAATPMLDRHEATPILEARNIVKTYGHVHALEGASFTVYPGEVVALIGDNGAGKSTLTKIISGVIRPDSGELLFDGRPVEIGSPAAAQQLGIETVYQDLALAPDLDGAANVYMGRELLKPGVLGKLGVLDKRAMKAGAETAFRDLGVAVKDADAAVAYLSGGQRQGVAVARAASWASRVIIMDEPTAALGVVQTENVLNVIRRVRDSGVAVVLISHNMPDVLKVADRIEVLRLGRRVAVFRRGEATLESLVGAMTGAVVQEESAVSQRHQRADERRAAVRADAPSRRRRAELAGGEAAASRHIHLGIASDLPRADPDRRRLLDHEAERLPRLLQHQVDLHRRVGRADAVGRDDVRDHHRRHRPVGRLGARLLRRDRAEGDGGARGRRTRRRPMRAGASSSLGIAAGLAVGLGWGLFNGVLIALLDLPPLIVTLGSFGAALGLADVLTGGVDLSGVPEQTGEYDRGRQASVRFPCWC